MKKPAIFISKKDDILRTAERLAKEGTPVTVFKKDEYIEDDEGNIHPIGENEAAMVIHGEREG